MNFFVLYSWLVLVNFLSIVIISLALWKLDRGVLRNVFILLIVTSMMFFNPLIYFWAPDISMEMRLWMARLAFFGILVFANAFTIFIIVFSKKYDEFRLPGFYLFQLLNFSLILINFLGWIVLDVQLENGFYTLLRGPGYLPFAISAVYFFVYYARLSYIVYNQSQNPLYRYQLRLILGTGLFSALCLIINNVLVPMLVGSLVYTPLSTLAIIIFYSGIYYVLAYAEEGLVKRALGQLLQKPWFRNLENRLALTRIMDFVEASTSHPTHLFEKVELFGSQKNQKCDIYLSNREPQRIAKIKGIPAGWYIGLLEGFRYLQTEVLRLDKLLEYSHNPVAKNISSSQTILESKGQSDPGSLLVQNPVKKSEYESDVTKMIRKYHFARQLYQNITNPNSFQPEEALLLVGESQLKELIQSGIVKKLAQKLSFDKDVMIQNLMAVYSLNRPQADMKSHANGSQLEAATLISIPQMAQAMEADVLASSNTFNLELLTKSESLKLLVKNLVIAANSGLPATFVGGSGTGKYSWAKALHFYRRGHADNSIFSYSCQNIETSRLHYKIDHFIRKTPPGSALILRHLEYLDSNGILLLERLLKKLPDQKFAYFTFSDSFFKSSNELPLNIEHGLGQIQLEMPTLKSMKADLVYYFCWFCHEFSRQNDLDLNLLKFDVLEKMERYSWPGNFQELINFAYKAVMESRSHVIKNASIVPKDYVITQVDTDGLTPLEQAERTTIMQYLTKHKFNKNRTRIQLGITVNTLNTKIEKYGIVMPKSD